MKIGTCRADSEEVVCYHPEELVDYACRVWYEEGTDTLVEEQLVRKGDRPKEDRYYCTTAMCALYCVLRTSLRFVELLQNVLFVLRCVVLFFFCKTASGTQRSCTELVLTTTLHPTSPFSPLSLTRHTTTRLRFMDDDSGRIVGVQDCSRDLDGSKKSATYRYEKASQKYQPTIVF